MISFFLLAGLLAAPTDGPTVTTTTAKSTELERRVRMPASAMPFEQATLRAHVTGYVSAVHVRAGAWVSKGDVLATIEVPYMAEELASAEARIHAAEANTRAANGAVRSAQASQDRAVAGKSRGTAAVEWRTAQLARARILRAKDAITESDLENAVGALAIAEGRLSEAIAAVNAAAAEVGASEARVISATAKVHVAQADLRRVKAMGAFATIRCPYDKALVYDRMVDTGSLVEADMTALFEVMNVETIIVRVDVDERDAVFIDVGSEVTLTPDARKIGERKATVTRIGSALDSSSRRMRIEIDVPNTDHAWRAGMFVHADLQIFKREGALVLPAECLRIEGGEPVVYQVSGGKLARKVVTTGVDDGLTVEIASGVSEGDVIVIAGPLSLKDGMAVTVAGGTNE